MCIRDRRKAAKQLMQKTASNPDDIDAVIVATTTPDYHFPSTASIPVSYTHLQDGIMSSHVHMIKGIPVDDGDAFH